MCKRGIIFFMAMTPIIGFSNETALHLYRQDVEINPKIAVEKNAQCGQQSERIKREDAWRCVDEEGGMHDPCFSKPWSAERSVVCPTSPWEPVTLILNMKTPLDNSIHELLDMSKTLPWAIELKDGTRCLSVNSNHYYEGNLVRYQCNNSSVLMDGPHRCTSMWTILQHNQLGVNSAEIATAWF